VQLVGIQIYNKEFYSSNCQPKYIVYGSKAAVSNPDLKLTRSKFWPQTTLMCAKNTRKERYFIRLNRNNALKFSSKTHYGLGTESSGFMHTNVSLRIIKNKLFGSK